MTRADLERIAAEKYPPMTWQDDAQIRRQEGYIQGRLDQAEADAKLAESLDFGPGIAFSRAAAHRWGALVAAGRIREGVE